MTPQIFFLALVAAGGAIPARHLVRLRRQARRTRRRHHQMPEALERMATGLRAGASLPQALTATGRATEGPLGPELAALAAAVDAGEPILRVLQRWAATRNDNSTRLAATALALSTQVGAAPARALDTVATTLRERRSLAAERHAQATQARTSAIVLSAAPVAFTTLLVATNQAAATFLLATPLGWMCLLAGIGLDILGAAWMARLTRAGTE